MPERTQCVHIKLGGRRCGSPALTGRRLCYFHARLRRRAKSKLDGALPQLLLLEDAQSIQGALMQVIDMLMADQIELKKARLIVDAIRIARENVKDVEKSADRGYLGFADGPTTAVWAEEDVIEEDADDDPEGDVKEQVSALPTPIFDHGSDEEDTEEAKEESDAGEADGRGARKPVGRVAAGAKASSA